MNKKDIMSNPAPTAVFGDLYSHLYDTIYEQKDYEGECDTIEEVFRSLGVIDVRTVLDLGCGTGSHTVALAMRGYQVTGIDSSSQMLAIASSKARTVLASSCPVPSFLQRDVRGFDLHTSFDAAIMMFAVLGYQNSNDDVFQTLRAIKKHLKRSGLLIFDVWYGPAVLTIKPSDRVLDIRTEEVRTIRTASTVVDVLNQAATVKYRVLKIEGSTVYETEEHHRVRFFFPQEIRFMLSQAGLETVALFPFGASLDTSPKESDWNVVCVARAL